MRLTEKCWRNLDPWECCGQDKYCQRGCHDEGGCANGCIVPKMYCKLADYEDAEEQCIAENQCGLRELLLKWKEFFDDVAELYDYRAIGTVSEFRELKEKATAIRTNAIDEFVERLCTVCCGESMGVILGNRVKADMLTVDGVCEIAYEIAEAMKGE